MERRGCAGRWQLKPLALRLFGKKKRDITDRCGRIIVGIARVGGGVGGGGDGEILPAAVEPKR